MNIFQTVWSALTTQNDVLIKILSIPLTFLEFYVSMLYFNTVLNIDTTKKQKFLYVIIQSSATVIINFLTPSSFAVFINIALLPILVFLIFKTSFLKSIAAAVTLFLTSSILEYIFLTFTRYVLSINYELTVTIPLYRILFVLALYTLIYLLYRLVKYFKVNVEVFDNITTKNKIFIVTSIILCLIVIASQFYLGLYYNETMPFLITLIAILGLVAYSVISIYNLINVSKLELTKRELENANLTIHSLTILHDTVRSFKHDFDNIVNGIGGYVVTEDMEGLKKYYNQLLEDCQKTNNLYALSPNVINHPAIYHMLATKYYDADQKNVNISLNVFLDLNEIEQRMKIYDFTRILGILLDNAIDAATECDKKQINVTFRKEINKNDLILVIIQNTYKNKDVNTEEIYQKGVTSKENHSGLGLWKIRQILMRNNNLNLFTTKNNEFFTQQFEIYK